MGGPRDLYSILHTVCTGVVDGNCIIAVPESARVLHDAKCAHVGMINFKILEATDRHRLRGPSLICQMEIPGHMDGFLHSATKRQSLRTLFTILNISRRRSVQSISQSLNQFANKGSQSWRIVNLVLGDQLCTKAI